MTINVYFFIIHNALGDFLILPSTRQESKTPFLWFHPFQGLIHLMGNEEWIKHTYSWISLWGSPEWICFVNIGMAMSRRTMPQTHGNEKASLDKAQQWQGHTLVWVQILRNIWLLPKSSENRKSWTQFPSSSWMIVAWDCPLPCSCCI